MYLYIFTVRVLLRRHQCIFQKHRQWIRENQTSSTRRTSTFIMIGRGTGRNFKRRRISRGVRFMTLFGRSALK